jgi:peptidyl-prolyl cis-trans isomerase D
VISFLRNRLQGIVAFSFLGIVALTFAFLGLPTFTQTFTENNYATIGKYSISQSEYFRSRSQVEQNLREQFGEGIDFSDPALIDAIQNLTNNSLIEKYTIINFFDEIGIEIPDSHAETELSKIDSFNVDGKFDQELFKNYLINFNLTKQDLVEDYKSDLKLNLAVSLLDATSNSYASSTNQYLDLLTERRTVQYVKLDESNVSKDFVSTEDELLNYYDTNKDQFLIPEKRSYYAVTFNKEVLNIVVSEEVVRSAYDQYLLSIPSPEKRVAHVMLIGSNYENEDTLNIKVSEVESDLLNIGFTDAVKKYSEDLGTADIGGDLGFTNGEVFPVEFETQIADLSLNEVSQPIFYEGNVHFLSITEVESFQIPSFEDKQTDLSNEIAQINYEDKINEFVKLLSGTNSDITEVKEFADSFSLTLTEHEAKSFLDVDLSSENSSILFQTSLGTWSDPLQITPEEHVFAFVYDEIPSDFESYDDVVEQIEPIILKQKRTSYLEEIYADISDFSLDKESLTNLFSIESFKVEQLKNINRSTSLLNNEMVNIIFSEYETDVVKKELLQDGLLLYTVSNRINGDISKVASEDRESIEIEVKAGLLQLIFNNLRAEYDFDNKLVVNPQFASQNP